MTFIFLGTMLNVLTFVYGDRLRKMLKEQSETMICREKIVKMLEELHAQAEVALCFASIKHSSLL